MKLGPWRELAVLRETVARYALLALFLATLPGHLSAQIVRTESFGGRDAVAGEIIVRFRDDRGQGLALRQLGPDIVTTRALLPARAMLLRSRGRTVAELMREYSARPDVLYAEPNYLWRKEELPNDLFFESQWGLRNTGQDIAQTGTPGADIGAVQAWDIAQGSRSVVIGIVDSGVDYNHPDLTANMWSAPTEFTVIVGGQLIMCPAGSHGFNAITKTCDPMDDDPDRHGTRVAGIIGASGDNGLGIAGVSRVASLMALKFIDNNGSGSTVDAIAAIEFAIKTKAVFGTNANVRILNNSWGNPTFSLALLDAINQSAGSEMLFVAAAGNDSQNTDTTPHYPSSYNAPNIISVAATDNRDALYVFSNYGPTSVDLGAPGQSIISTQSVMTYSYGEGTSMATAIVSGAAGLVLSGCSLTTGQLKANLLGSVDPVGSLQSNTLSGGRLNVYRALVNCAGEAPPVFILKSAASYLLPDLDGAAETMIAMNPLNGFSADVTLGASAPAGISVSFGSPLLTSALLSTTVTVTADSSVAPGTYGIYVTGTSGGIQRTAGIPFIVGIPVSPGQTLSGTWSVNTSEPDRFRPGRLPTGLADWYRIVVNSSVSLEVSLFSPNADYLRLLDSSGTILVATDIETSNTLQISRTLTPGAYSLVASTAFSGAPADYNLAINAPLFRFISPSKGEQGSSYQVQLSGRQFAPPLTLDAGNDITVSNLVLNSSESASASLAISPTAVLGPRTVTVSTPAGISNGVTFTVERPRPVITSISPPSVVVGTSVDITILGANFIDPEVWLPSVPSLVTLDNVNAVNTTMITARITVAANAEPVGLGIEVRTLGGFTISHIQILPLPPVLTSITPSSATLGSMVDVTLTGTNFWGPMTIDAGSGILVADLSIMQGHTALTARFRISSTTTIGNRNVTVTTAGGTSGSVTFSVMPAPPPTLTSVMPAEAGQSTTRGLLIRGTNFTTGFAFNPGPGIAVKAVELTGLTQATVTIEVGSDAALGPRDVTVSTVGGTSNPLVFTVLPPPPTLTGISPSSGVQESTFPVTLTGTNFRPGLVVQAGPLQFNDLSIVDSTTATAVLTIPVSTATGLHNVVVSTTSGPSPSLPFTVLPGIPTLAEIRPKFGIRGGNALVTLLGTNFASSGTTISPIPGVAMNVNGIGGGSLSALFIIFPSASVGPQTVTVTTPGGTTNGVTFSIYDPFPDLSVGAAAEGLWAGLENTYVVTVFNTGTADAASPIIVTDLLPPELTFVSGGGNGFSCSAAGQLVTCTYSGGPFAPGSSAHIMVKVAVSPTAPPTVTHTVSAPYSEDFVPENNTVSRTLAIQQPPDPVFMFTPLSLIAGQQATVALSIPTTLPQTVTGTLAISFLSTAAIPSDDPSIQFATGGRQVTFTIPAGALEARFVNASIAGPIGYQTGTVAGSITFDGTLKLGTAERPFSSAQGTNSLTIAPASPAVHSIRTESQGGFAALITSSSTPRSITELNLEFFTSPIAQLSCGAVSGCTTTGSTLTFDVKALFDSWFTANSQYGSLNTLRVPLTIQGTVRGSVSVTLKNSLGTSNAVSFSLP